MSYRFCGRCHAKHQAKLAEREKEKAIREEQLKQVRAQQAAIARANADELARAGALAHFEDLREEKKVGIRKELATLATRFQSDEITDIVDLAQDASYADLLGHLERAKEIAATLEERAPLTTRAERATQDEFERGLVGFAKGTEAMFAAHACLVGAR